MNVRIHQARHYYSITGVDESRAVSGCVPFAKRGYSPVGYMHGSRGDTLSGDNPAASDDKICAHYRESI